MHDVNAEPRDRERRARIEARNATQWLARLARSYAGAPEDEIRLVFDPATRRILTPELAPGIRVGLALPALILQFEEVGRPTPHPLDVDEKSSTEVEAWLLAELLHRDLDRGRFSKSLPYDWPRLMSGDEAKYASHDLADELRRLTEEIEAAAGVLAEVERALGADAGAGALACWPQNFSFGIVVPGGAVRVLFTPGEDADDPPRYRVSRGVAETVVEIAASTPRDDVVTHLIEAAARARAAGAG